MVNESVLLLHVEFSTAYQYEEAKLQLEFSVLTDYRLKHSLVWSCNNNQIMNTMKIYRLRNKNN
jgi:hypothetical protein